ncbi:MAG: type I restriction endonuclease subunit R [bacterium]
MGYTEHDLEMTIIQMLKKQGYEFVNDNHTWIKNRKLNEYLIENDFIDSLSVINKGLKSKILDEVFLKVKNLEAISLIEKNMLFHNYMINGVNIEDYNSSVNPLVKIIDFDNIDKNIFKVVHQVKFNENSVTRIPDIIIYVNGIPLVIFELKSIAVREDSTIEQAYEQLGGNTERNGYRYDIPTLFNYNAFNVISDGANNRVGTLTSSFERFSEWKSIDGADVYSNNCTHKLDVLIYGLFGKYRLLDILKNNLFFMQKDKEKPIKILTQYHQYFGVEKAYKSIINNVKPKGDGKAGIVWHTQGSGKSFSMVMLSYKLIKDKSLENPTIIILTDRNDLDDQLYTTFSNSNNYLRTTPVKVSSRIDLVERTSKVREGGIYFSTIQKIDKENIVPNNRNNVIIISDEAHRSHYGVEQSTTFKKNNDNSIDIKTKYGYEKYIRDAFPNATIIGFTGTPVQTKDKDTTSIFGEIIDTYDMTQSIEDGSTVKLFYEARLAKVWLDEEKLRQIDEYYEELSNSGVNDDMIINSKSKMSRMEILVGDEHRLNLLANDIINHYNNRKGTLNDKAMIVCMSRKIAYDLYNQIISIESNYKNITELIITSSNKDSEEFRNTIKDKDYQKFVAADFKNKKGKTKIVIVVDMWLTGFDVEDLDVMYIDKPMKDHNLMQAIARVNRVYKGKDSGLIVDYIGLSKSLDEALNTYTKRDKEINLQDIKDVAKTLLDEKLSILDEWFYKIDIIKFNSSVELEKFQVIQVGADFILENSKRRKEFLNITKLIKSAFVITLGILTNEIKSKIHYYLSVRHFIQKIEYSANPISLTKVNERISELLTEAIVGDEIKVLTQLNEDDGVCVWDLLKEEKIKELRESNPPHVFIKLIEKLLNQAIKEYKGYNLIKSQQYSEKLRKLLEKYNNRTLNTEEEIDLTIVGLIQFSQEMLEEEENSLQNNITGRERAFYDALSCDEKINEHMKDETLRLIASKLKVLIEQYAKVDWSKKSSTKAEMRAQIKLLLLELGYPPEYNEKAIERVINQAEYMM